MLWPGTYVLVHHLMIEEEKKEDVANQSMSACQRQLQWDELVLMLVL